MFYARFDDGPLAGNEHDRTFVAPEVPEGLFFALMPWDATPHTADGWALVGTAPGLEPDPPWPNQVEYRLDRGPDVDGDGRDGGARGVGHYKYVPQLAPDGLEWSCEECDYSTRDEFYAGRHSDLEKHSLAMRPHVDKRDLFAYVRECAGALCSSGAGGCPVDEHPCLACKARDLLGQSRRDAVV